MGAEEVPSGSFSSDAVDNAELSDTALVYAIRKALASVQNGDTDHYNQLVQLMYIKKKSDGHAVAQQEMSDVDVVAQREIFGTRIWDHKPNVIYALLDLIISLTTISGKYLNCCLDMLVSNLRSQPRKLNNRMREVLSRLQELVPYVDNLLKLENRSIRKVFGKVILMVVMERLRDLDLEIWWDDILQDDSSIGMFDMELDVAVEGTMNEGEEFPVRSLNQNNVVSELLDKLMVLSFEHLESCQNAGRLDELFGILFESFENLILNTDKSKFSQLISPNFIYWSKVKKTYDKDDEDELFAEVIVYGDTNSEEDCDDDLVLDNDLNKMSITPKHSFMRETERLLKMPSRIRPSTSPRESL